MLSKIDIAVTVYLYPEVKLRTIDNECSTGREQEATGVMIQVTLALDRDTIQ